MNVDWTAVLVTLLGSNLAIEIWKTISASIQKRRKLDVESELSALKQKISDLEQTMTDNMKEINKKLNGDFDRFVKIEHTLEVMTEAIARNSKGTILSLENDVVVFNALRTNHINGESERQEKKLADYYKECAEFNLKIR